MNAPFLTPGMAESETLKPSTQWARNAEAFFHLALTQRRLAHRYRRWALEDEAAGRLVAYRHYRDEAKRLLRDAKGHLSLARHHRELGARHG